MKKKVVVDENISVNNKNRLPENEIVGRSRKESVLNIVNSAGLKNRQLLKCTIDSDVMVMEFADDLKGWGKDGVIQWLQDKVDRMRGFEAVERIKAEHAIREVEKIISTMSHEFIGFKVEVNPNGGTTCTYSSGVRQALEFGLRIKNFSYKLLRKVEEQKKLVVSGSRQTISNSRSRTERISFTSSQLTQWLTIASSDSAMGGFVINDNKSLEEGKKYTYRLIVTDLTSKETNTYEETILYDELEIDIAKFEGKPDPIKKKIVLTFDVKNASLVRITRLDSNREISSPYVDLNVKTNEIYEYLLVASNHWNSEKKSIVVSCKNMEPSVGKITYTMEVRERGVTLVFPSVLNGSLSAIERKLSTLTNWDEICSNQSVDRYTDVDESEDERILKKGSVYNYRVLYSNEWGKTYSSVISIVMANSVPKMPRMLPPNNATLRWIVADDAKKYFVKRVDSDSDPKKFNRTTNSFTDSSIRIGRLYTYTIVARNGWGDSETRYHDVIIRGKYDGRLENCFDYKDNILKEKSYDWTQDFQGITTDGNYWYFTNGSSESPSGTLIKTSTHSSFKKNFGIEDLFNHGIAGAKGKRDAWARSYLDKTYYVHNNVFTSDRIHFGDIDVYRNYLFAPVYGEGTQNVCEVWIIDAETLDLKRRHVMRKNRSRDLFGSLGWCAVNPHDERLYTSDKNLSDGLRSYKIIFDGNGIPDIRDETEIVISLFNANGEPFSEKGSMQGGCFDYYNNIYLNSGYFEVNRCKGEGIHVFKLIPDESKMVESMNVGGLSSLADKYDAYISGNMQIPLENTKGYLFAQSVFSDQPGINDFAYSVVHGVPIHYPSGFVEFFTDWDKETASVAEEPEGLTYYDFDNGCSLYVSLLDNDLMGDDLFLMQYHHLYRETEEKKVYYNPSNLKVVNDSSKNEWKVVDGEILVKKFNTSDYAKKSLRCIKKF